MKLYRLTSFEDFPRPENGCVLSIGNFDGVHVGHQSIIRFGRLVADDFGYPLKLMTFEPSAAAVLRPEEPQEVLTPVELKTILLSEQKPDSLIIVEPTREFLSLSAEEFIQLMREKLNMTHLVEGETFGFGRRREGEPNSLVELAEKYDFKAHFLKTHTLQLDGANGSGQTRDIAHSEVTVTSTLIRQLIRNLELEKARTCLGREYMLSGRIVSGRGEGRNLGFPTANLQLDHPEQLIPRDGVYAGWARLGRECEQAWRRRPAPAAISIGRCETYEDGVWQIEAYLLDYEPAVKLAGRYMLLSFTGFIRPQRKFESREALAAAIGTDIERIREMLSENM